MKLLTPIQEVPETTPEQEEANTSGSPISEADAALLEVNDEAEQCPDDADGVTYERPEVEHGPDVDGEDEEEWEGEEEPDCCEMTYREKRVYTMDFI